MRVSPNGLLTWSRCDARQADWDLSSLQVRPPPGPTARGIQHSAGCSSLTNWQEQTGPENGTAGSQSLIGPPLAPPSTPFAKACGARILADSILQVLLVYTAEQPACPEARAGAHGRHAALGRGAEQVARAAGGRPLVDRGGSRGRAWPDPCPSCLVSARGGQC